MLPLAEQPQTFVTEIVYPVILLVCFFACFIATLIVLRKTVIKRQQERLERMLSGIEGMERQLGRIADSLEKSHRNV
jgi:hypothetical protein